MNGWLKKWGVWIGPSTLVAIIGLANFWTQRGETAGGQTTFVRQNRSLIEQLDKRANANDQLWEEHGEVTRSRIAQLDRLDRDVRGYEEAIKRIDQNIEQLQLDVRELRVQRGLAPNSQGRR